jgi:hypothetical protein
MYEITFYIFKGIIICLNESDCSQSSGSLRGVIKIGAKADSKLIETCVVLITPNTSKKKTEFIPIILSSHSTAQDNLTCPSQI